MLWMVLVSSPSVLSVATYSPPSLLYFTRPPIFTKLRVRGQE